MVIQQNLVFLRKPLDFIIQSLFHIILFFEFKNQVFEYFKNCKLS